MSFLGKMKIALGTAKDVAEGAIKGEEITVSEEEKQKRLDICLSCPFYVKDFAGLARCNQCDCYMNLKTALSKAKCPVDKW